MLNKMRFYLSLICVALYVAHTNSYKNRPIMCTGQPLQYECHLRRDLGHDRIEWCKEKANTHMWYYNILHRSCNRMFFLGCGGNNNRFCTEQECIKTCVSSGS